MEEYISFEKFLYEDSNEIVIDDMEFCVDRIVMLPKIRPHKLQKAVSLSIEYCKSVDFRRNLLEKSCLCPVLIYQLYQRDVFSLVEIEPFFMKEDSFMLCYYFWKVINDFQSYIRRKNMPPRIDVSFLLNGNDFDQLINYGYLPSSIEYCLKYDVIDDFVAFNDLNQEAKWSPFEWSNKPEYLDLFSFAGFFGSIKCFKNLLMKGFKINEQVFSMVVCSGCFDLFHLCQGQQIAKPKLVGKASEFFHIPLLDFLLENGSNIDAKDNSSQTPLHYAVSNGHISIVEYLVNHGAEISVKKSNGFTSIDISKTIVFTFLQTARIRNDRIFNACKVGDLQTIIDILKANFFINTKYNSDSLLNNAARNGHLHVVEYLINQKADINIRDGLNEFVFSI